jgi:hypothetical protein
VTFQRWWGRGRSLALVALLTLPLALPSTANATPPAKPTLKTWGASSAVKAQVIVGTTLYFGGDFTSVISPDGATSVSRRHLAAVDLTTGDLLPWNPVTNGGVDAMVSDGTTIFIGGAFTTVNNTSRSHLAALDATGALLPFKAATNGKVEALHLVGTTVYIGGDFTAMRGVTRFYLGALTTSGTLLPWDPSANDRVRAITSVSTGDIVVGGFFTEVGGQGIDHIDSVDPVTGASHSWSYPSSAEVVALITGPDDNVYGAIAGSGGKVRSWTNDGHLRWTVYTDGDVNAVSYVGGQVIAGGHWIYMNSGATYLPRLAAFDPATGAVDLTWQPKPNKQIWSFATDATDTTLTMGGVFTSAGKTPAKRLAIFQGA